MEKMTRVSYAVVLFAIRVLITMVCATEQFESPLSGVRSLLMYSDAPRYEDKLRELTEKATDLEMSGHALNALLAVYEKESQSNMPWGADIESFLDNFFKTYVIDSNRIRRVLECDPISPCPELNVIAVPISDAEVTEKRFKIDGGYVTNRLYRHVIGAISGKQWNSFHHAFRADFVDIQHHQNGIFTEFPAQSFLFQILGDMQRAGLPFFSQDTYRDPIVNLKHGEREWAFIGFHSQFFAENNWKPYSRVSIKKQFINSCDSAATQISFVHTMPDLDTKYPGFATEGGLSVWIHEKYTFLRDQQPIAHRDAKFVVSLKNEHEHEHVAVECVVNCRLQSEFSLDIVYDERKHMKEAWRARINAIEEQKLQTRARERDNEEVLKRFEAKRAECIEPPAGSVVDVVAFRVTVEAEDTSFPIEVKLSREQEYTFGQVKACIAGKIFDAMVEIRQSKQEPIDSVKWPTIKSILITPGKFGREAKDSDKVDAKVKTYLVLAQ
eukprot:CAMPEP_0197041792 /NCGR_PEP_ID=MMETSP1384-20130603/18265_1 /TAXON_ID=29189 /ORGANISM="Ammonia sp." /LENGTH=496 /DNA_ID=CAMNT_0042472775 /DNA_START=39 /DNA_END=1529 /DNA_ORIENTATION=-